MEIHKRDKTAAMRAAAKDMVKAGTAKGEPLTHCAALETLAKKAGFRNYQAYCASAPVAPTTSSVQIPAGETTSAQPVAVLEPSSIRPKVTERQVNLAMNILLAEESLKDLLEAYEDGGTFCRDDVLRDTRLSISDNREELDSAGALHVIDIARERRTASNASTSLAKQTGVIPNVYICIGGNCRIYLRQVSSEGNPYFLTLTKWDFWSLCGNDGDDHGQDYDIAYSRAKFKAWCEGCAFLPNLHST